MEKSSTHQKAETAAQAGKRARILILEDREDDVILMLRELRQNGLDVEHAQVSDEAAMREALSSREWDAIIADINIPGYGALAGLKTLKEAGLDLPFIVVSGQVNEEVAVGIMKAGAHDFVSKDKLSRLAPAVEREIKDANNRRRKEEAEYALRESNKLLKLLNRSRSRQEYLDTVVRLVMEWTGCAKAGVRLINGRGEIPYAAQAGFSREFWEKENNLILSRDECACTRVIRGKLESQDGTVATSFGSFRCGNSRTYIDNLPSPRVKRFRGACVNYNHLSLAVVPIKYGAKTLGAIQIADEKENMVPEHKIRFIEAMIPLIGEAINKFNAREKLKDSENKARLNNEIQLIMNKLTKISLEEIPLKKMLERVIDELLAAFFIRVIAKCGIWLKNESDDKLELTAQRGLSAELLKRCRTVEPGTCLCGRAAETGKIEFSNQISETHSIAYPDMEPHGHYCVPILAKGKVLGVMNFYLKEGHAYDKRETGFLAAASNVVAGIIVRQRAKEALLESEEKYRRLVNNANEAVVIVNEKGYLNFANAAFYRISGYDKDDLSAIHFSSLIHPDDHDRAVRHFQRRLGGKTAPSEVEYRIIDKDDKVRYMSYNTSPIKEGGKVIALQLVGRDVTENKHLEDKIRRAKEHYEQVIDTIEDSICVIGSDFKVKSCNQAFAGKIDILVHKIKGRECGEIITSYRPNIFKKHCMNSGIKASHDCLIAETFQTGRSTSVIEETRDEDGEPHYHQISLFPAKDSAGRVYQVVVIIRDITKLKQSENEIRRLHEFNQRILDNSPVSIVVLNREGKIISANNFGLKLMGRTEKEAIGRNLTDTENIRSNKALSENYRLLLEQGRSFQFDNMVYLPHDRKKIVYLSIIAVPLLDSQNRVEGAISMALNNTEEVLAKQRLQSLNRDLERKIEEQKIAQEKIRKLSEINQHILDNVPLSIVMLDASGKVVAGNRLARELMDKPGHPMTGNKLTETREISSNPDLARRYTELFKEGKGFYYDNLSYTEEKSGKSKMLNIIAVPLFNKEKIVDGAISMAIDNTEAVRAKKKLRDLNRELEHKVRNRTVELNAVNKRLSDILDLKSKFVADASHELRTPLTVIQGNLDLAIREAKMDKRQDIPEIYLLILDEVERMRVVLSDLSMLTSVDVGNERIEYEPVDLARVARSTVQSLKVLADQKNVQLEYDKKDGNFIIMGDESKLEKLLSNLVRNGVKYTNSGGFVRVRLVRDETAVIATVEDSGIGIPKEDQPHIFERFYRVDKARSRKEGGTGLGLSIAKWIVETHGGEITVESVIDKGSRFIVRLPFDFRERQNNAPTLF